MIKKIKKIFDKKSLINISLLIVGLVISAFLETLSISLVPLFISYIIKPELFIEKLSNFEILSNVVLEFIITYNSLFFISLLIISIFILKNIFFSFIVYIQGFVLRDTISKISNKLFSLYMLSQYENVSRQHSSNITNNLINEVGLCFQSLNAGAVIIRELIVLMFLFFMVFFLNPKLTISIFMIFLSISLIFYFILKIKLIEIGKSAIKFKKEFIQSITESLGLFTDIKILNKENYFINIFKSKNYGMYRTQHHRSFISMMSRPFFEITSIAILLVLTAYLFSQDNGADSIIPTLTLITVIALRLIPAFNLITSSMVLMRSFKPSIDLIYEEFNSFDLNKNYNNKICREISSELDNILEKNKSIIQIKNLSFSYKASNNAIFNEANILIKKNKFISVIGDSGSGKSTLIKILLGLLEPVKGNIYYHSSIIDNKTNRPNIGYVPQSIFLKDDTIKNNIALGVEEKDINEIRVLEVIKICQLNELVSNLKNGIETVVGERGSKLSGGQIQRIGLARALYIEPEILVLDEATNALDISTEKKIIDMLLPMKNKKTVIMITHRTWDLELFDSIIEVKENKCSEIKLQK